MEENVPAGTLIELESQDVPIGDILNDAIDYNRRKTAIHRVKKDILQRYLPERFFETLKSAIRGGLCTEA